MAIPKYQRIIDDLKQKLISGEFESDDKFYTEAELIEMYDVSSITVVRALNELAKEGYIVRKQGKGTFVSRARKHKLVEFSDIEVFPMNHEEVVVLSIERGNDDSYCKKLDIGNKQFYYKIERIRRAEGTAYIFQTSYIPEQYINSHYPNLDYYKSIYRRFREDYHIHMNEEHFWETNEVTFPSPKKVAERLEISENFPTVFQTKLTRLRKTNQIIEYAETYKRGDYYKIKLVANNKH